MDDTESVWYVVRSSKRESVYYVTCTPFDREIVAAGSLDAMFEVRRLLTEDE